MKTGWRVAVLLVVLWQPAAAGANDILNVGEAPFISGGPYYIARDRGYFDKVGIEVRTKTFNDGALAVPALISGELDVSVVTMSAGLFNSIAKGAPMVMFLDRGNNNLDRGGTAINVSNQMFEAGLKSPGDLAMLKGKRVGVTALGSINQYEVALALMQAGLDPRRDVQWVTGIGQPDLVKMLGRNLVDATDLAWQFGGYAADEKLGPLVMDGGTVDKESQVAAYAVQKGTITAKRDILVRFAMAVMFAAREFNAVAADPDKYPDTLALLTRDTAGGKAGLLKSFAPRWTFASEDGMLNVPAVLKMQDFWVDTFHLSDQKISPDQMIDVSIAKEARERLDRDHPFGSGSFN